MNQIYFDLVLPSFFQLPVKRSFARPVSRKKTEGWSCFVYRVDDAADKVVVVDRLEVDVDVAVQQARLGEELGLLGQRLRRRSVRFALGVQLEDRALQKQSSVASQPTNQSESPILGPAKYPPAIIFGNIKSE